MEIYTTGLYISINEKLVKWESISNVLAIANRERIDNDYECENRQSPL